MFSLPKILPFFFFLFLTSSAFSLEFPLPAPGDDVVGELQHVLTSTGNTLPQIGSVYNIGYVEMFEANPDLPKHAKLAPGTEVLIPSMFILPKERQGLVINLAELRVYYFPPDKSVAYTFPIAAGREGWNTPVGNTTVVRKVEWPIRLHGTLAPKSIGGRVSHGCMRLWDNDIEFLYNNVPVGTPVTVTHNENKVGWLDHKLYLEAEIPFPEYQDGETVRQEILDAMKVHPGTTVDWDKVQEVLDDQAGIPVAIGHD